MYRLWESLIKPIFDILHPTSIVEIGSGKGGNTLNLIKYCLKHGGIVHAVDPEPEYNPNKWKERYGENFIFYRELSLNALPKINVYDVVLVDGDHNWYTVYNELLLVEENAKKNGRFPVVMLHDVEWPYGRRDLYYYPKNIPDIYRKPYEKKAISPDKDELVDESGLNAYLYNAIYENNKQNGVLTAVEDFLKQSKEDISLTIVPGIHGLGILASLSLLEQKPKLAEFLKSLKTTPPISKQLHLVERQRIEEIILRKKLEAVLKKEERAANRQLFEVLDRYQNAIKGLTKEIGNIKKYSDQWFSSKTHKYSFFINKLYRNLFIGKDALTQADSLQKSIDKIASQKDSNLFIGKDVLTQADSLQKSIDKIASQKDSMAGRINYHLKRLAPFKKNPVNIIIYSNNDLEGLSNTLISLKQTAFH